MPRCYVGFDCGTMGTKVAIYADDSRLIAEAYRPHEISYPHPGWAEMEPDQFYRVVSEGLQECVQKSRVNPRDVRGISCSGVICGFLPIDDDWRPVGPYIPFLDGRAKEEAAQVTAMGDSLWADQSGNADIGAYMPPMYCKWLLNHDQGFRMKTRKLVTAAQYVLGRLGGLKARDAFIDWAHMSGWIIGFDAHRRDWSEAQMKQLGIPFEILPKAKKPWDVVGALSAAEAVRLGLRAGIPLVAGAGDIMQSNLGSGIVDTNMCSDVAGTASIFTFTVKDFRREVTDKKVILNAMSTLEDQYMYWSFIPAGGLSLRWFRDEISHEKANEDYYMALDKEAMKSPIGSEMTLFFPFLQGRSSPAWPNASAAWLGMHGSNNRGTLWRSMLESIAFEYLSYTEILRSVDINLKRIVGTGGGSKGQFWNQMKADILNAPYVTLERTEGAVLGNALLAAYGVGDITDLKKTVSEWVKVKDTFNPIARNTEAYEKIYAIRQEVLNGPLHQVFDRIADLHKINLPE
jgi:xylulokinase